VVFNICPGQACAGDALPVCDVHNLSGPIQQNGWRLAYYDTSLFDTHAFTGVQQTPSFISRTEDGCRSHRYFVNMSAPHQGADR